MRMLSSMFSHVRLHSFNSPTAVDGGYAILSHVWQGVEQPFHEIADLEREGATIDDPRLSFKVRECHRLARSYDLPWFWIDAPCIDRQSSAELSEAIRSMYKWYSQSSICFAYLADVPSNSSSIYAPNSAFRRSKYFLRGWTLQELIAPRRVVFLSKDWTVLGEKRDLASLLEEITGIDVDVLTFHRPLSDISVARRLSWASRRETSRPEDMAYCLMGLFDIHMPILYGEGDAAFGRLQEAILQKIRDHTLLAWEFPDTRRPSSPPSPWPFAPSPATFAGASRLVSVDIQQFVAALAPLCEASNPHNTSLPGIGPADHNGLKCHLPVLFRGSTPFATILACREAQSPSSYIALALYSNCPPVPGVYHVGATARGPEASALARPTSRLLRVNLDVVAPHLANQTVLGHDAMQDSVLTLRFTDFYITSATPSSSPPARW
ncbi:hypothetical protein VTO73DRAFT_7225 [Trametes versicolor]